MRSLNTQQYFLCLCGYRQGRWSRPLKGGRRIKIFLTDAHGDFIQSGHMHRKRRIDARFVEGEMAVHPHSKKNQVKAASRFHKILDGFAFGVEIVRSAVHQSDVFLLELDAR